MKAYKIDEFGVKEVDADPDALLEGEVTWDCVSLDEQHDLWVDDFGLSNPDAYFADIGKRSNIPLPAYVFGGQGENTVAATLDLEAVIAMTRLHESPYDPAHGLPMLAMDVKMDAEGRLQPWRVVLAFPNSIHRHREYLMRLPRGQYWTPPGDDVRGSYLELPLDVESQSNSIMEVLGDAGCRVVRIPSWLTGTSVARLLGSGGISFETLDMHVPTDVELDDTHGIGGGPGHQIAHMADPILRERRIAENRSDEDDGPMFGDEIGADVTTH